MPERDEILSLVAGRRDDLRRLGVVHLSLFGSAARGELSPSSDVDFIVELKPKTFDTYMNVKIYLEDLLGRPVDLALSDSLKPRLREKVLREAASVAGLWRLSRRHSDSDRPYPDLRHRSLP